MAKQGFYYDQTSCIGCKTCQIACKDRNHLDVGTLFRRVETHERGTFPSPRVFHFAATCNHCANPACVSVCPTGAMFSDGTDGTVQHDDSMCIGCQYCVTACPYGNPRYLMALMVVHKCDACIPLRTHAERPACVAACPMRALEFGPLEELRERHPDATDALPSLPSPAYTQPSLLIDPNEAALLPAQTT
ncbi:MAG: 4Fe-4S dicluster domain-containing protein [Coriobacteriales bacterium]|jgi:anaerobic dimethyl sulfoxide reductase subunit B (iron-sulfur subunit)|nr:4Fe-4S dicluster domain-containing protein [Coriobacteriales bacterium]